MGGTLVPGGATFRVWAPRAHEVHVLADFNAWTPSPASRMQSRSGGHWTGFVPGLVEGDAYQLWVVGPGGAGWKRDPRARELSQEPAFPRAHSILRNPARFPWHETGFAPPAFSDLIVYQLHVGTFSVGAGRPHGKFLDVVDRLPHLEALGVNAIEPLPIDEFPTEFSMGYNGTDYYAPENDYAEADPTWLARYLERANRLLLAKGLQLYALADLVGAANQLRAMVDLCHVHGIAVILDVVYNHAGGGFDDESLWFLDRMPQGNNNDSLYFTDQGWAGGLVFAYWNQDVRQFLIDNALGFYEEYRVDGFRLDEVSVMDRFGGWSMCRDLTGTLHQRKPQAPLIAEYWPVNPWVVKSSVEGGAGFDATWHDGLRDALRAALAQASAGRDAAVDLSRVASNLAPPGLPAAWRGVQCIENHDLVKVGAGPRIPRLADPGDARSWYARSRARVATGLLLTAPGIPMLFMGQELLEDRPWTDDSQAPNLLAWERLSGDGHTADFLRFLQDLVALRRGERALRDEGLHVFHVHDRNRVLAFQRWVEGVGRDVVVVASLAEETLYGYRLGFPGAGRWREVFNSDAYENWPNPTVAGNAGAVEAGGDGMHGLPASASIVIPASSILVFTR